MSACETCWNDAYARARMLGGTQVEHYRVLLSERDGDGPHQGAHNPTPNGDPR